MFFPMPHGFIYTCLYSTMYGEFLSNILAQKIIA